MFSHRTHGACSRAFALSGNIARHLAQQQREPLTQYHEVYLSVQYNKADSASHCRERLLGCVTAAVGGSAAGPGRPYSIDPTTDNVRSLKYLHYFLLLRHSFTEVLLPISVDANVPTVLTALYDSTACRDMQTGTHILFELLSNCYHHSALAGLCSRTCTYCAACKGCSMYNMQTCQVPTSILTALKLFP